MDAAEFARFETELGYPLPKQMLELGSLPPHLEGDVDRLIELNRLVREPGTPWIGEAGEPWPEDHVVIGEDQCGNYWSVLRVDLHRNKSVWFYDHEIGTMERQYKNVGAFLEDITVVVAPEKLEVGEWRLIAHQSVGSINFGMTRHEIRTLLDQPYSVVSRHEFSDEPADEFDTLDLYVHYVANKCVAVEFCNPLGVMVGGHRLGDECFSTMASILPDFVTPDVVTPTSFRSLPFGIEFRIERPERADEIGAIYWAITTAAGYFTSRDEAQ
jgi:hypothetical protein